MVMLSEHAVTFFSFELFVHTNQKRLSFMRLNFSTILIALLALLLGLLFMRYFYSSNEPVQGKRAPGFSAQLIGGEPFDLEDLKGYYVLLDFWGSWCAPCRQINPELVAVYQKFRNTSFEDAQGFRIVSIGIERDTSNWREAIKKDGLDWPYHIMDTTSNLEAPDGGIAGLYGVEAVPTSFLLSPDGIIIGVDLLPWEIDRLLENKE